MHNNPSSLGHLIRQIEHYGALPPVTNIFPEFIISRERQKVKRFRKKTKPLLLTRQRFPSRDHEKCRFGV